MNEQQQQAHPCEVACEFMKRSDMKGGEVEAYAQTFNWLQKILAGELIVTPKEEFDELQAELKELRGCGEKQDPVKELDLVI